MGRVPSGGGVAVNGQGCLGVDIPNGAALGGGRAEVELEDAFKEEEEVASRMGSSDI